MEQQPKTQLIERIKAVNNVLVTVSANPTVDQLAACIGLTLLLNKLDKHATAVFSGAVPSTLEFLEPEKTLEQNTDSLRDFIISLDKSKADKLRYKVEDSVVKIFITPYRTSLSSNDLEFSQGDFNVELVIALGVTSKEELDQAILAHGRILHDATVYGVSAGSAPASSIGSINWHDPMASSLSEMVTTLAQPLKEGVLDGQIATALLTGVVAETDRFSNEKTSPQVMTLSAQLMAAGANQQLIANKLAEPVSIPVQEAQAEAPHDDLLQPPADAVANDDGSLSINHDTDGTNLHIDEHGTFTPLTPPEPELPPAEPEPAPEPPEEHLIDVPEAAIPTIIPEPEPSHEVPQPVSARPEPTATDILAPPRSEMPVVETSRPVVRREHVVLPPERTGTLTANTEPEHAQEEPTTDPMSQPKTGPLLQRNEPEQPVNDPEASPLEVPEAANIPTMTHGKTLEPIAHEQKLSFADQVAAEQAREQGDLPLPPIDITATAPLEPAPVEPQAPEPTPEQPAPEVSAPVEPLIEMPAPATPVEPLPAPEPTPAVPSPTPVPEEAPHEDTLEDIEKLIGSAHVQDAPAPDTMHVDEARKAVESAAADLPPAPQPISALNAQPLGEPLRPFTPEPLLPADPNAKPIEVMEQPEDPNAPPKVPPPMTMPQFFDPSGKIDNPYVNPDNK